MAPDSDVTLDLPSVDGVTPADWSARREQWLELFSDHVYGRTPAVDWTVTTGEVGAAVEVDGGSGIRRQLQITISDGVASVVVDVLLVLPVAGPSPVLVALNFFGNHTVTPDADVALPAGWVPARMVPSDGHRASETARGFLAEGWPLDTLLRQGFGMATVYAGDIAPDDPDHVTEGLLGLTQPQHDHPWGALGAWAWGLSCVRRVLAERDDVRADQMVAIGHSRLGKAALWAGAQDEGFAAVVSNNSGCGGASLSRRPVGERVAAITTSFPHWFTPAFAGYAGREHALPVDQHQLLASIAPRALYVASAAEDEWADPVGEYLATAAALEVHQALGSARVGYHLRPGGHALGPEDWEHVLTFLRHHVTAAPDR
ncbi:glucuronyl esterase domain-containing protein [Pseudactinotalea suaedae]|uniref:glucuronyl esterase domain-containing protein n=1 Tax=Pseudactinotalea suaedae TaxID=1524924 RepID=UPI0012E2E137|nr:acetylxylan esterase [Pseudactinotalea suaedae]